jgi:Alpha-N-acetylglucosaminidase (NAGLU) N-terminal domain
MLKVVLLLVSVVGYCAAQGNTSALEALVARQLPFHADSFVFYLSNQSSISAKSTDVELDTFTLFDGGDGKVHIECSTTSACSRGLYT